MPPLRSYLPCFTPQPRLGNTSFAPRHGLATSATPCVMTASRRPPVMVLGIPRIFAPSTRTRQEQIERVVEAPSPPPSTIERTVTWVRIHPLQAVVALSFLSIAVRRMFQKNKRPAVKKTSAPLDVSSPMAASSSQQTLRAIPKRHETTEEALDLLGNTARKYIIVGGKGGVGKTSMSAAVATAFADRGQTTLIVSTDPAHSLSDAFGQSVSGGDPVPVSSVDNLYAQEVDPDSMKRTFKMMSDLEGARSMGMDDMGLDELNSLFDTIPPGFDEAVALVEIVKYIEKDAKYARFDRIVFDTAPTGHTLRLLSLPDFLNGFFGKIISMKSKFGNVMSQLKGMFGSDVNMDNSVEDMEELKRSMNMVRELFRDEIQTEFIVATIPNMMAIAESQRLVDELYKEKIPIRHVFVNQVQPSNDNCTFCAARYKEQRANLKYIEQQMKDLQISTVQSFDKEIKGAPALRAMASQLFPNAAIGDNPSDVNGEPGAPNVGVRQEGTQSPPVAKAELVE